MKEKGGKVKTSKVDGDRKGITVLKINFENKTFQIVKNRLQRDKIEFNRNSKVCTCAPANLSKQLVLYVLVAFSVQAVHSPVPFSA